MTQLDVTSRIAHRPRSVTEQSLLFILLHQAEQVNWLGEVVRFIRTKIMTIGRTVQRERWLAEVRLLLPFAISIRLVMQSTTMVTIYTHRAVTMKAVHRAAR